MCGEIGGKTEKTPSWIHHTSVSEKVLATAVDVTDLIAAGANPESKCF